MYMRFISALLILFLLLQGCSIEKLYQMRQRRKINPYEQVDFGSIIKRYFKKESSSIGSVEGIYSVSSLVTKKGKGFLSDVEKEKIVERKENYSKVAVIYDPGHPDREYLEISLDKELLPSYSVRGEFTGMSEGNIMVYKHFEARGKILSYTFTYDKAKDILEGIRTESDRGATITYKLTYLKLFPKAESASN